MAWTTEERFGSGQILHLIMFYIFNLKVSPEMTWKSKIFAYT